jgi:hypothetical protein
MGQGGPITVPPGELFRGLDGHWACYCATCGALNVYGDGKERPMITECLACREKAAQRAEGQERERQARADHRWGKAQ